MKMVLCLKEALRYSNNDFIKSPIYLSKELEHIISESRNILRATNIILESNIESNIFVETDKERFSYFILIIMDLLYNNNSENNVIIINLKKAKDDDIILSFSTDSRGTDNTAYHNHSEIYNIKNGSQVKLKELNFYIIRSFCNVFGINFITSKNVDDKTCFTFRFPPIKDNTNIFNIGAMLSSDTCEYRDKFSKYNVLLTDFIE